MTKHNSGIDRIAAERKRQIEVEGWTPEHDMRHSVDELVRAAAAYTVNMADFWPWSWDSWKPSDNQIHNLEKAGGADCSRNRPDSSRGKIIMGFKCPICKQDFGRNKTTWEDSMRKQHLGIGKDIVSIIIKSTTVLLDEVKK